MRRFQTILWFAFLILPLFRFFPEAEGTDISQSPKVWRLVGFQEHGLLADAPSPADDGTMGFSDVSYNENGGQFVVTIGMAKINCPEVNTAESIFVKWSFTSDIRTLPPGGTIPINFELKATKISERCPRQAVGRTEITTTWSSLSPPADYFPDSEKGKYWGSFSFPKEAPGRRFNYYVSDDPSTSAGTPELMVNAQTVPSQTDPQYGWFAIHVSSSGCCLAINKRVNKTRGNYAFYYIYKLSDRSEPLPSLPSTPPTSPSPPKEGCGLGGECLQACGFNLGSGLYDKWAETGGETGKLGCPIMGEIDTPGSPCGTTGRMTQFKKDDGGYIIWHRSGPLAGKSFEVSGCMYKLYSSMGGAASWLCFPTSDGYVTPTGSRQDFEGGYITWDSKTWTCNAYRK
jgi:hypothetical protein